MITAKRSLLVPIAIGFVIVAAAPHYRHTRPQPLCGVPEREYQFREFSQPQISLSRGAVLLPATVAAATEATAGSGQVPGTSLPQRQHKIKSFQFVDKPTLRIDHCSISQMSVLLHESGCWSVSLRADQNPLVPETVRDVTTSEPAELFTDHLRRNQFFVDIRCYAAAEGNGGADGLLGRPLIIPLYVTPFWVQRQQPRPVFVSGYDPRIEDYFDLIDRVEIEFQYRND